MCHGGLSIFLDDEILGFDISRASSLEDKFHKSLEDLIYITVQVI